MNNNKSVLIAGASFAGLSSAYWLHQLGYAVTIVEIGHGIKQGGTPVNLRENTIDIVKRMGLFEEVEARRLPMQGIEFIDAAGIAVASMPAPSSPTEAHGPDDEIEIERDTLLRMIFDAVHDDVAFLVGDSIAALAEYDSGIDVSFKSGVRRSYDLVLGCDGIHSSVRALCFGMEADYLHPLGAYFSITIIEKLLIAENTSQLYNEPGLAVMLNAYNGKTDIVLCFASDEVIDYDYRDEAQQRAIIASRFAGLGWRVPELLAEIKQSRTFYFDKLCQIKMPSWTRGRVALVGDAAYCASPAAGMGGSLAIDGASALADALDKHDGDHALAFADYDRAFRPFIEQVQADAVAFGLEMLVPRTAEAIRKRNAQPIGG